MKKTLLLLSILFGVSTKASAVIVSTFPAQYQAPRPSSSTGVASEWLIGKFELRKSTADPFPVVTIATWGATFSSGTLTISTNVQVNGLPVVFSTSITAGLVQMPRPPDIVSVGTAGMPNVDFTIVRSSDLWAVHARLLANGILGTLLPNTTVYGRVMFVGGPFDFSGATIPAGITWEMRESSSCLMPIIDGTTGTIITAYGNGLVPSLVNFKIDGSSQSGYSGEKVVLSSNTIVNGLKFVNFPNVSRSAQQCNLLYVRQGSSNVVVNDLSMDNFSARIEQVSQADGAAIYVFDSTGVYFNRPHLGKWTKQSAANASVWGFAKSADWHVRDGIFDNAYQDFLTMNGGNVRFEITRNVFHVNGTLNNNIGVVVGYAQQFGGNSTGTITSNIFYQEAGASATQMVSMVGAAFGTNGVLIAFNCFYGTQGTTTAISVQSPATDTFLLYNFIEGMISYSDTGTRTRVVQ